MINYQSVTWIGDAKFRVAIASLETKVISNGVLCPHFSTAPIRANF